MRLGLPVVCLTRTAILGGVLNNLRLYDVRCSLTSATPALPLAKYSAHFETGATSKPTSCSTGPLLTRAFTQAGGHSPSVPVTSGIMPIAIVTQIIALPGITTMEMSYPPARPPIFYHPRVHRRGKIQYANTIGTYHTVIHGPSIPPPPSTDLNQPTENLPFQLCREDNASSTLKQMNYTQHR